MSKTAIQKFEDNFDKVVAYYFDPRKQTSLPEDLMKQLDRWKFIRMVYTSWRITSRREVLNALVKEYDIDEATAYRDIANAQRLYVRLEEINTEFERIILIEKIKKSRDRCTARGDEKGAAMHDANLIKIGGFNKELEPPKIVQHIHNELVFDPKLVDGEEIPNLDKVIKSFLTKKKKALEDEFAEDAEIITDQLKNVRIS